MATNTHNLQRLLLALTLLAAGSGCCCQAIPLPGEHQCPTDARRLYCTCGEEAVRRCPCGPDRQFYGLKPTCWREWPEGWHCNGCEGFPYVDRDLCGASVAEARVVGTSPEQVDESNPFQSNSDSAELPLPHSAPEIAPTQSEPADNTTSARAAPPIASATQAQPTAPQPMPVVPAAVKLAVAPILIPPQNAESAPSVAKPDPKPVQLAAVPNVEKKHSSANAETSPPKVHAEDRAMSRRVEQHLLNNLQL